VSAKHLTRARCFAFFIEGYPNNNFSVTIRQYYSMRTERIFIAINLPDGIKEYLVSFREKWPELPARWTKKENLHLTLVFLGNISDEELLKVCQIVRGSASRSKHFPIRLTKIIYGPPRTLPPRMVWVQGELSETLAALQDDLERSLAKELRFSTENRAFSPHITLARIHTWSWRRFDREERPEINEEIDLSFEVTSLEIMESRLKRGGAEYTILESVPLSRATASSKPSIRP
jgi:2'-5' RNA ligase